MDNAQPKNEANQKTTPQTVSENMKDCKCYRQADVLDQTRLRALSTVLRYSYDAKIVSLLLNLKSRGKADLTVKFVSDRLKYLAKHVDLNDANAVNLFIARKQCLESQRWLGKHTIIMHSSMD